MTARRALLMAVLVLAALPALWRILNPPLPPLPTYGAVPDFALVDQAGKPVTRRDLDGHPWVADFFFTSCPTVCPRMSDMMRRLGERLGHLHNCTNVHLVSISVDPDRDTPPVLAAYARRFGADPARWRFLTGKMSDIEKAAVDGFKLGVEHDPHDSTNILHGTKLVLVDGKGAIRGYYDADEDGIATLARDAARLADEDP